jgi:tetratricopeptide (TPR) repeat protein
LFCWERPEEAIREYQRAIELDPMQSLARMQLARVYIFGGQYKRARPYVDETIELFPKATPDPYLLASILIGEGKKDSAVRVMDAAGKEAWLGYLYGIAGRPDMTRRMLDSLTGESARRNIDPIHLAVLQITLDRKDQAISSLEKGYAERSPNLRYALGPHPAFNSLRTDARFKNLRRRVGYRP